MFEEHCAKEVQQKRGLVLRSQCVPTEEGFYYFKIDVSYPVTFWCNPKSFIIPIQIARFVSLASR